MVRDMKGKYAKDEDFKKKGTIYARLHIFMREKSHWEVLWISQCLAASFLS